MVKVTLLLHFFQGKIFLGQKLHQVSVTSAEILHTLIDLLAHAKRPQDFHSLEAFPEGSEALKEIQKELGRAYKNPYCTGLGSSESDWKEAANSIRVVQVIEGYPFNFSSSRSR